MKCEEMNLQLFGGWDEVTRESGGNGNRLEFTKLENGITELRFLDEEPFVRWAHWLQNCKRNISCIGVNCPVCNAIKSAKSAGVKSPYNSNRKFAMHVYNFKTGKVEMLEQSKTFFASLLALHQEMGDIRGYNIKVKTQNAGTTDVLHTLLPCPPTELDDEIKEQCKELKPFEEVFKLATVDQIIDLMNGKSPEEVFSTNEDNSEDEKIEF